MITFLGDRGSAPKNCQAFMDLLVGPYFSLYTEVLTKHQLHVYAESSFKTIHGRKKKKSAMPCHLSGQIQIESVFFGTDCHCLKVSILGF